MPPVKLDKLSRREREIMDILYEHQEASAQQVLSLIPDPPSYSTIRALIARLVEKGIVGYRSEGKRHIYAPKISENKAQNSAIKRLIKIFFGGSRSQALSALLDINDAELSAREIEEIERKIQRLKSKH